jgi:hypothetical protein
MPVGTGQTDRERHTAAVADHMAFAPSLGPVRAATAERRIPVSPQVNKGDEALYPNRIGNFFKGPAP